MFYNLVVGTCSWFLLQARSEFYTGGDAGQILSVEILHNNGICIGAFPACTVSLIMLSSEVIYPANTPARYGYWKPVIVSLVYDL